MQYGRQAGRIIDWALLWERLQHRLGLVHTAVRYQAGRTNWQPPTWWRRMGLSWFRVALFGLVLLFFSRNQVRFKIDVVDRGDSLALAAAHPGATTAAPVADQLGLGSLTFGRNTRSAPPFDPAAFAADDVRKYVQRFARVAETEARKFGIPAPVKMAIAILESQAGQTREALDVNNHFGPVTAGNYYESAWANWRAHSQLIDERYPQLREQGPDVASWLAALARTDYSNDPEYTNKLRQLIDHFDLDR
jgi:hypothetical protein